jgi:hypothetical protein
MMKLCLYLLAGRCEDAALCAPSAPSAPEAEEDDDEEEVIIVMKPLKLPWKLRG